MLSRFFGCLIGLVFVLSTGTARSQTAEETVLFMLFGYEKGKPWYSTWDHTNDPRYIHITRTNDCKFLITQENDTDNIEYAIDFSAVSKITATLASEKTVENLLPVWVKFIGVSVKGKKLDKINGKVKDIGGDAGELENMVIVRSVDTVRKAIAYYRSTYCKGRAF